MLSAFIIFIAICIGKLLIHKVLLKVLKRKIKKSKLDFLIDMLLAII